MVPTVLIVGYAISYNKIPDFMSLVFLVKFNVVHRLFDMNPGKYNLNMNALNCMKDKEGYCVHNPAPKTQFNADINKSSQLNHKEEVAISESENEDCARINSVDKWPRVSKRLWKLKQQKSPKVNTKRMRLISESDQFIELGVEDVVIQNYLDESAITLNNPVIRKDVNIPTTENTDKLKDKQEIVEIPTSINQSKKPKPQFRSTHFDIRSSPIKLPSALVRKFQLDPQKVTKMRSFEVQILRPLTLGTNNDGSESSTHKEPVETFEVTLGENDLQGDTVMNDELTYHIPEDWGISESNDEAHHKLLFESNLAHEKDALGSTSMNIKEETCLFEPSSKPNIVVSTMIHDDKNESIEPSLIHVNEKSNCLFETSDPNLLDIKENTSAYFESSAIHGKTNSDSLIDPSMIHVNDKSFEAALSNVRQRLNNLFEPAILHTKSNTLIETKSNNTFDSTLSHVKERSNNLYDSGLMHIKDKDTLIGPSLIHVKENNIYDLISHRKDDLIEPMIHDKSNVLMDSALMDVKDDLRSEVNICDENDLNTGDPRLLSSEGQSVLNFLESLSNEHLGLAYPETDIRNSSVDFQLDLFSFNSS